VHVGAVDAPEFKATISTTDTLKPLAEATKGTVRRLVDEEGQTVSLPQVLPVSGQVRTVDENRLSLRMTD
jgi:hypothetical protein